MLLIGARLRSDHVLDELSLQATNREHNWRELRTVLLETAPVNYPVPWDITRLAVATQLACVLAPDKLHFELSASVLLGTASRIDFSSAQAERAIMLATQIAALANSADLLSWCKKWASEGFGALWAARVDMLRPAEFEREPRNISDEATQRWWSAFNEPFIASGVESFELRSGGQLEEGNAFTAMRAAIPGPCEIAQNSQPRVSIIVPTFNPEAGFAATVESLARQSWENIEILIVDDCSTSGQGHISAAKASDPRVRVIRLPPEF